MANNTWIDKYVFASLAKKTQRELVQMIADLQAEAFFLRCCWNCSQYNPLASRPCERWPEGDQATKNLDACDFWKTKYPQEVNHGQ